LIQQQQNSLGNHREEQKKMKREKIHFALLPFHRSVSKLLEIFRQSKNPTQTTMRMASTAMTLLLPLRLSPS